MKEFLTGGGYAGGEVLQAYVGGEDGLDGFFARFAAIKLLESFWSSQNAFFIYIPGIVGSQCAGWKNSAGNGQQGRYCGEKGMLILAGVSSDKKYFAPVGIDNGKVSKIGGYGIREYTLFLAPHLAV